MKKIKQIKDELAIEEGYQNWDLFSSELIENCLYDLLEANLDDVAKRYAEEALKEAAKRALVHQHSRDFRVSIKSPIVRQKIMISEVDKQSILDIIKTLK